MVALSGCGENSADSQGSETSSISSTVSSETNSIVPSAAESTGSSEVSSSTSATVTPAGALGESQRVDPSYFDDAVFIGDSVSNKLRLYVTAQRKTDASYLGKAQFLTAGSLGSHNALWDVSRKDSVHPAYEGKQVLAGGFGGCYGSEKGLYHVRYERHWFVWGGGFHHFHGNPLSSGFWRNPQTQKFIFSPLRP